jgi:hypothetical protein
VQQACQHCASRRSSSTSISRQKCRIGCCSSRRLHASRALRTARGEGPNEP